MIQTTASNCSDTAIRVRGVGKSYTIKKGLENQTTLAEAALQRLKNPLHRAAKETFWALQDIDMDIKQGEVVGIIGRNGAGKSTLLKTLSRITYPTTGEIDIYGKVGSLLEVGTGFHPELTGRENIYLNGAILGMDRGEIKQAFDAIVDFAGVEKFLETPVKRYSSGMYVRLAFAVAAHLRTEVLIVDEVLAVGDAGFQQRCLGKMEDVSRDGRTVLFVSHQMQAVQTLCTRGIFLDGGNITFEGGVEDSIDRYMQSFTERSDFELPPERRMGQSGVVLTDASVDKPCFGVTEGFGVNFGFQRNAEAIEPVYVAGLLMDSQSRPVAHFDSRLVSDWIQDLPIGEVVTGRLEVPGLWLKPGVYRLDMAVCGNVIHDRVEGAVTFNVEGSLPYPKTGHDLKDSGVVLTDFAYQLPNAG